jgi:hypothetical protein
MAGLLQPTHILLLVLIAATIAGIGASTWFGVERLPPIRRRP